ncbi:MAG: prepilin-type N-terminal cleavage/methylation domain-containing protein [Deltaproteobacteria bacterium]|nr:prepilin-type N-terminal cleavage/methylation domain-containing protein [Deltaproteobacteria bacterium]
MTARARREAGFTLIEILVAMLVLTVGLAGILSIAQTSSRAVGFARHATEASVVGEDKVEALRRIPSASLTSGSDLVDARAVVRADGLFTRRWDVQWTGTLATVQVVVTWIEDGDSHLISYRTMRGQ